MGDEDIPGFVFAVDEDLLCLVWPAWVFWGNQADLHLPSWTFITSLDGKLLPLFSIDCCLAKRWVFGVEAAVLCLWIIGWVAGNRNEKDTILMDKAKKKKPVIVTVI